MKTFRVYFTDGNQKIFEAPHIVSVIKYIVDDVTNSYGVYDIVKVEEVEA